MVAIKQTQIPLAQPTTSRKITDLKKILGRKIGAFFRFGAGQLQAKIPCMTTERVVTAKTIVWP